MTSDKRRLQPRKQPRQVRAELTRQRILTVRAGDTETAARLTVSTVELVVHQLMSAPDSIDIPRFENELVAMLTRYLTAG